MSPNSETFDSLSSEEDDEGEHHPRRARRCPQWMPKRDLKEKVQLSVGLKFSNPTEFKKALQVFAVQNSFDYKYQHNEKTRVSTVCKKNCPWRIHAASLTTNHSSRSKPSTQIIIVAAITTTSGQQYLGLLIDI
jgi:hypothetical protein